jgi:hypothetical protein
MDLDSDELFLFVVISIVARRGVSKEVEDSRRSPALRMGHS